MEGTAWRQEKSCRLFAFLGALWREFAAGAGNQGGGESERGGRGESGVVPGGPRVILCSTRKKS